MCFGPKYPMAYYCICVRSSLEMARLCVLLAAKGGMYVGMYVCMHVCCSSQLCSSSCVVVNDQRTQLNCPRSFPGSLMGIC